MARAKRSAAQGTTKAGKRTGRQAKNLVIVESPAKARTVKTILGDDYEVIASVGHVRDLPVYGYGLEDFDSFRPKYVVVKDKRRGIDKTEIVSEIADASEAAEHIYLSTDPDREGEAIAWHITEAAKIPEDKTSRVVFHEITKPAIEEAFRHPGKLNHQLVEAQQARRIIDRLMGFPLTWFLQSKVSRNATAGRVQSVALRLIVERERDIQAFTPVEYWSIHAQLARSGETFEAELSRLPGERGKPTISDEARASELIATFKRSDFAVKTAKKGTRSRAPAPPFTTSTFQQAASNRLGLTGSKAMTMAQQLYEGVDLPGQGPVGLITYMRTDSVTVAQTAQDEARAYVGAKWGADYVPEKRRVYRTRSRGAQEAHEAIRPTSPARSPESLREVLNRDQLRVYRLIWQRFMASQMSDARFNTLTVDIDAKEQGEQRGTFRASAQSLMFKGHLAVYAVDEDDDDAGADGRPKLPELADGDALERRGVDGKQHFTEPPPRFTEASLVKAMEEQGIGRPSTYAQIVQTVLGRKYVTKEGRALVPQELGFLVNDLLVQYFNDYVAVPFTSEMEEQLDDVAEGERDYDDVARSFWSKFSEVVEGAKERAPKQQEATDIVCSECEQANMVIKWGRNGKFLACPRYPDCKHAMPLTQEGEPVIVAAPEKLDEYHCPRCNGALIRKTGPYGPYVDCENREDGECDFRGSMPVGVACPEEPETGQLVEKRSKRGYFYGCWNYPNCGYTTKSIEPDKLEPPREESVRIEANKKLLERSQRGKKAWATRQRNRTQAQAAS